jgi:hypothetical protein
MTVYFYLFYRKWKCTCNFYVKNDSAMLKKITNIDYRQKWVVNNVSLELKLHLNW